MAPIPGIGEISICCLLLYLFLGHYVNQLLCLTLVFSLALGTFVHFRKLSSVWSSQSVPGPRALPFLGNPERIQLGNHLFSTRNSLKYGKIWGGYQFMVPELYVSEIEVLKQVLVKEKDIFTNRQTFRDKNVCERPNPSVMDVFVNMLHDDKWKYVRGVMAPTFTTTSIKKSMQNIQQCVNTLVKVLDQECRTGNCIDMKNRFSRFAVATMISVGFGIDSDCQENMNDPVLNYCREAFDIGPKTPMIWFMALFPLLSKFMKEKLRLTLIFADGQSYFTSWFKQVIQQRRKCPKDPPDFLQYLMNAENRTIPDDTASINKTDKVEGLTEFEMISQMVFLIFSGSESTSSCLTFMSYLMAINPDVQEKCYHEVVAAFGNKETLDFDDVESKLNYLESCIKECLRLYPPGVVIDRKASKSFKVKGITVPQDGSVVVPVYYIHHSEEYYYNPEKFIPERFLPEQNILRDPLTFLPFGYGQRDCMGTRLAMAEMKLCYANLLRNFCFTQCEQTKVPLSLVTTGMRLQAKTSILIKLQKR